MVRILSSHACHGSALRSGYFSAGNWIVPVEKLRKPGNAGRMELELFEALRTEIPKPYVDSDIELGFFPIVVHAA
jgi:hypothetical protein